MGERVSLAASVSAGAGRAGKPGNKSAAGGRSQASRLALIHAAERLVAQRGIAGVTLSAITEAAKALNASAIHYHFGSLEVLLKSVFEHRFAAANGVRMEMLAAADPHDLRGLMGAMVHPLAAGLAPKPAGNWHLRFLQRIYESGDLFSLDVSPDTATGWQPVQELIRESLLRALPRTLVDLRIAFARAQLISGLAEMEARLEEGEAVALPILVEAVIDSTVAVLTAPVSAETQAALRQAG